MTKGQRKSDGSRRRGRRGSRRAEGHDAALAEAEGAPRQSVPEHPLVARNTPVPVTEPADLAALVEHVRAAGSFAFDTEFIGEETYHPRICVIQVATADRVALVDPLGGLDVSGVWELIADPTIETIVHAGAQDLEPIARELGRPPANVFDTQIAAGFAGRPFPLGLRRLVEDEVGVRLGKALTFSRWDLRPLSAVHVRYAADDVRYLPAVRAALQAELESLGHAAWAQEECGGLADIDRYRFDPGPRVMKLMGSRAMKRRNIAVLWELVVFREEAAKACDLPPRTFLKDDVLVRLARELVRSVDALSSVKGLPRPVIETHGPRIIEATQRGLDGGQEDLPSVLPEEQPADRVAIDALWSLTCAYCRGRSLDPALVANRRLIARTYDAAKRGEDRPTAEWATGWRREFIGGVLDDLLAGRRSLEFRWSDGRLHGDDSG